MTPILECLRCWWTQRAIFSTAKQQGTKAALLAMVADPNCAYTKLLDLWLSEYNGAKDPTRKAAALKVYLAAGDLRVAAREFYQHFNVL